jgi:uncharacterized membrane protein YdbT with pleckstrin-like domain
MIDNLNWSERKRIWCGLPWTFTKYGLSDDRFFVEEGLFTTKQYDVRLYRILNISLSRTLIQKIFGLGTIHIDSTDKDLKCFEIVNVKNSEQVKELISEAVEKERVRNRVTSREFLADSDDDHDDHSDY